MKLQTKLTLVLLGGMLTVYGASCVVLHYVNAYQLRLHGRELAVTQEAEQWAWVERLEQAVQAPLIDAMAEGEMDKFEKILATQRTVPGLQEVSLHDSNGRIAYSSEQAQLKKMLPDELKRDLLASAKLLKRRTDGSFELYQPVPATKSCVECHTTWKEKEICGVMSLKFSADIMKAAEASWSSFEHDLNKSSDITSALTAGALVLVLAALVAIAIHFQLTRPLRKVAEILSVEAIQVGQAAAQLSAQSQSLAEGASEQASSLEETSASLEQIDSMTKRNAQSVQGAKNFTAQTRATAESGAHSTQAMGQAMQGIRTASGEMRDAMNGIKSASNDVGKIIKTIDEIAFQTNILALNAAVEAARAGEAGMGFAVVADEVRNLAQRSAKAARETTDMIKTSIKRSDDGVRVTEKVVASVAEVTGKSQQLEAKLAEIVANAQKVDEQVTQVALAAQEQNQGISEMNMAVSQMDKVTQRNAAAAEESAAAAEVLNDQAEGLKDAVNELQQLVSGGKSVPAPSSNGTTPASKPAASRPGHRAIKPQHKPVFAPKSPVRKSAGVPSDRDFPMPEPTGAGPGKNGFQDF